jgi:hypothetical protein
MIQISESKQDRPNISVTGIPFLKSYSVCNSSSRQHIHLQGSTIFLEATTPTEGSEGFSHWLNLDKNSIP